MITLSLSGVVGDGMTHWELSTFLYDTLYFIFVSILFSNIISGIMTDTFAEMRDKRNFIEADKKNNCFMCGIERTIVRLIYYYWYYSSFIIFLVGEARTNIWKSHQKALLMGIFILYL